jgi:riboflavin kinase/FMN adenylyltransferase
MEERYIEGLDSLPPSLQGCVLTIGNFDGVHLGHQQILHSARALGDADGITVAALTFEPPPELVLRPEQPPLRITPSQQKYRLLLVAGADYVVAVKTDRDLLRMSPKQFIDQVIVKRFAPTHVVEGRNFFFGRGRSGNIDTLAQAAPTSGFVLHVVEPVMVGLPDGAKRISSTLVRELVLAGRIEDANRCLGREFALYERVVPGKGHGRILEFPTVNVDPHQQVVPLDGVYAGKATVNGDNFSAAISIGSKPTLGPSERAIEAFLIGARGDLYGKELTLAFTQRLRDQQRFETPEQLKAQIAKDVERVREICG